MASNRANLMASSASSSSPSESIASSSLPTLPAELRLAIYELCDGRTLLSLRKVCRILRSKLPMDFVCRDVWFTSCVEPIRKPSGGECRPTPLALPWLYPINNQPRRPIADHVRNFILQVKDWATFYYDASEHLDIMEMWYNSEQLRDMGEARPGVKIDNDGSPLGMMPAWNFMLFLFPNLKHVKIHDYERFHRGHRDGDLMARQFIEACPLDIELTWIMPWDYTDDLAVSLEEALRKHAGLESYDRIPGQYLSLAVAFLERTAKQKELGKNHEGLNHLSSSRYFANGRLLEDQCLDTAFTWPNL